MRTDLAPRTDAPTLTAVLAAQGLPATAIDALAERLPIGVLVADRYGRVVYENPAALALDAAGRDALRWAVTQALLTEEAVRQETVPACPADLSCRWLALDVAPVRDASGRIAGAIATVADTTARHRVDEWQPMFASLMNL